MSDQQRIWLYCAIGVAILAFQVTQAIRTGKGPAVIGPKSLRAKQPKRFWAVLTVEVVVTLAMLTYLATGPWP